jgi:hypothetical protein
MPKDLLEDEILLGFEVLVFEKNGLIKQHESFALDLDGLDTVKHGLFLLFVLLCLLNCLLSKII